MTNFILLRQTMLAHDLQQKTLQRRQALAGAPCLPDAPPGRLYNW